MERQEPPVTNSLKAEEKFFPDNTPLQPPKHSRRKMYGWANRTVLTVGTGLYVPVPKAKEHGIAHKDQISISWQKVSTLRKLLLKGLSLRTPSGEIIDLDSPELDIFISNRRESLFDDFEEALIWLKVDPKAALIAKEAGWE